MLSAAMLEARRRGAQPFAALRVTWATRGYSLGTDIIASKFAVLDGGQVTHVTPLGGWDPIEYGSGIAGGELVVVETKVGVIDIDGSLLELLETYDPRGSAAAMDWVLPQLVEADWTPLFRGIVADWERDGPITSLLLKTDDTVLRSPVPSDIFLRAESGSTDEASIFGTHKPLVTGVHDSWQVTARGMAPTINIRYDEVIGYWYLASIGQLVLVRRIFFDGHQQGDAGWSVLNIVQGATRITVIVIAAGFQPSKGVVVSFDCEGPDEDGLTVGDALTGAPDQLRMVLSEYVYRPAPLTGWRGDASVIDATTWAAASAFFALHLIEAARRFGGEQEPESGAEVVDSFLQSYPWARIRWTTLGTLAIDVLDPDDVDPSATAWFDIAKHHEGGQVELAPGDRREVYTHVKMPFMWSSAEQKFLTAYEAHDVAALPEKVVLTVENIWSQGRLTRDTPLNPAAPADPIPALLLETGDEVLLEDGSGHIGLETG